MPGAPSSSGRHSILDLAPLELDCMNALWPIGEATVRDIQLALQPTTPRAYTTIMTILDRLAQKGIVLRRKSGRAWVYRANLTAEEARSHALDQLVNGFFAGSSEGLAQHLAGQHIDVENRRSNLPGVSNPRSRPLKPAPPPRQAAPPEPEKTAAPDLDASLL
jgi:BlaI family transcriptional regulator, penicillinase repressor